MGASDFVGRRLATRSAAPWRLPHSAFGFAGRTSLREVWWVVQESNL